MMIYDAKDRLDSEKDGNFLDDISDDDKDRLEEAIDEAEDWLNENEDIQDKSEIQDRIDRFDAVVRPIVKKYAKAAPKASADDDLDYKDEL